MSKSFKRVLALLAAIFIIAFAGAASAATNLTAHATHITEVPLVNGKPSYTSAVFGRVEFYLSSPDTEEPGDSFTPTTGTMTITGGDFSFGDSQYVLHQGEDATSGQTFNLTNQEGEVNVFRPVNKNNKQISF
ncbi:MAG: hypothetical protein IJQ29_06560, partial [Synergistaceae bacterium]|nr:hypothetical protein [Synergistaceae bacterium]